MEKGIVIEENIDGAISSRYLTYAVSTIVNRALPDARDGLKPVHRRILYAMFKLSLLSDSPFRKCAKIVGEVMGNYHPHGDKAIYDALVRLAQDFSVRYTLIDGQGNFGNVDGDNAAAQRYTEARLDKLGEFLLEGINEDSVNFKENYDGSEKEPEVIPATFPNLLANGASGIAVGMATNIPPHNISELSEAMLKLIASPDISEEKLSDIIPGPDFPTGGIIVEDPETITAIHKIGRGAIRLRGEWEKENLDKGAWQIVIKSIPYQVQKSRLIEKIADLISSRKLPTLVDVRDESTDSMRIILEPKTRNVDPEAIMQILFRSTDLQTRFNYNMNVLVDGRTPKLCSLRELLTIFLDHRKEVLLRRTRFRINQIEERIELLNAYLLAYLNLDHVIRIIRNDEQPKTALISFLKINERQAEAILNLRLRALRKLEEQKLRKEYDNLEDEKQAKNLLLHSPEMQWEEISNQIRSARDTIIKVSKNPNRLTSLLGEAPEKNLSQVDTVVFEEDVTVLLSNLGWVRVVKGHLSSSEEVKYREDDKERFVVHAKTTDRLLIFCTNGRVYTNDVANFPSGRGFGEPIRLTVDIPSDEKIISAFIYKKDGKRIVVSSLGNGFVVAETQLLAQTRTGKQILNLNENAQAQVCCKVEGAQIACISQNRKLLIFDLNEIPELGRGKGVRFQKFKDGGLSDIKSFNVISGLSWLDPAGRTRTEQNLSNWQGKRANTGKMAPRGFPKDNKFNL